MRTPVAILAAIAALSVAAPASAYQGMQSFAAQDADRAFNLREQGRSLALPEIERRVVPRMRGYQYLGPEPRGSNYRLKFVKGDRLVWVDVDARTGKIIGRHGF